MITSAIILYCVNDLKSRKENPQKLTQLSSRSHPRHLVGKRTAQKDITIDTTSDSQVNSNFPNRWSPASLTFNNYFYLFLYLYITWITTNNNAPHLKSPKNQSRRAALGRPAIKITGGLEQVCGRPTLALSSVNFLTVRIRSYQAILKILSVCCAPTDPPKQGCKIFFLLTRPVGLVGGKKHSPLWPFHSPWYWVKLLALCW